MGDGSLRVSLEPIEKDAPGGTIEDAFWEVESFHSMFVSEGKFGYRVKFKRFEDLYEIMKKLANQAESGQVKRAEQVERDPNIPECVVLSEDEELKAWESASEVDGMEECEGNAGRRIY
ncbi:unnamed protein product [Brachionus calyciflorus]|uniref:Uncharacterized protein n=1 Tax=Brachionus calyciflorus TaxID=104777 RepID=A0A814C2C4_9BILA|nr:unnamed protein product [Brachionus calyciflorus]